MKIGYYIAQVPYKNHIEDDNAGRYSCGGAELSAYYLALNMAQRGHEVNVFASSINSKESFEMYENINVYRYGTIFRIETANISPGIFQKPQKHQLDIIHAHFSLPPASLAGLWHAKQKNIPYMLTYHGDPQANYGSFSRRMSISLYSVFLHNKLLSCAKVIVSPSEYYIDESRFLGKYRDKIAVIPNGINVKDFDTQCSKEECKEKLGLPLDKKILLFFGYLSPYKGPDILVRAMPKILKNVPDTELVFVGKGVMRDELEMLSKRLGAEKNVKFAGFVKGSSKPFYYKAADVFVLPSIMSTESFGIVNLEAMACGVPIVASKIGGIPDVVKDGENGLLVPPKDSDRLASAIIYLLENEDIMKKMGDNGKDKVKDYSWKRVAEETEKIYKEILA